MTGKYLITTDGWFIAPDGRQYKAVWGEVTILQDSFLGVKTNAKSSNWYAKVGTEENHVIIAGCQIHYAVKCEAKPVTTEVEDWMADASAGIKRYNRPTQIWTAE